MTRNCEISMRMPMLAREVAAALGDEWSSEAGDYEDRDAFLIGPEGARILMDTNVWRRSEQGRIVLRGITPHGLHEHAPIRDHTTAISVSQTKDATQIARDVQRRLLPSYRAYLAAALANKNHHEARDAARAALAAELATRLGPEVTVRGIDGNLRVGDYTDGGTVTVPFSDDEVHFDLRFPQPLALDLATAIGELRAKASEQ